MGKYTSKDNFSLLHSSEENQAISYTRWINTEHNVWSITEEFWRGVSRREPGFIESLTKYFLCIPVFQIVFRQIAWPLAIYPEGITSSATSEITFQIIFCESMQEKSCFHWLPSLAKHGWARAWVKKNGKCNGDHGGTRGGGLEKIFLLHLEICNFRIVSFPWVLVRTNKTCKLVYQSWLPPKLFSTQKRLVIATEDSHQWGPRLPSGPGQAW